MGKFHEEIGLCCAWSEKQAPCPCVPFRRWQVKQQRQGVRWGGSCYYMSDVAGESCRVACSRLVQGAICDEDGMAKITTRDSCSVPATRSLRGRGRALGT